MPRTALLSRRSPELDLDLDDEEEAAGDDGRGPLASPLHAAFCFSTLLHHFDGSGSSIAPIPDFDHDGHHCPLFVTWDTVCRSSGTKSLRGCIGSLSPQPLASGLRSYALTSALRDRRFTPVSRPEVPSLHCSVSLLRAFEEGLGWRDWVPGRHGIIIEFEEPAVEEATKGGGGGAALPSSSSEEKEGGDGDGGEEDKKKKSSRSLRSRLRGHSSSSASTSSTSASTSSRRSSPASVLSATYLPHVAIEQGWGLEECIHSLVRKAGFSGKITEELKRELRLTRYESSMAGMGWKEYQKEKEKVEGGGKK